jgi:hypothetical protein
MKDTTKLLLELLDAIVSIESYSVASYDVFLDEPDGTCLTGENHQTS